MALLHFKFLKKKKRKKKKKKQLRSATKDLIQRIGMFGVSLVKPSINYQSIKINYQSIELEAQYFNIRFCLSVFTYLLSIYLIIFCRKRVL